MISGGVPAEKSSTTYLKALPAHAGIDSPSARNLHDNPQILNITSKRAANPPCIVVAWQRSSPFNSRGRGCPGGSSTTAGGWKQNRLGPPASPPPSPAP